MGRGLTIVAFAIAALLCGAGLDSAMAQGTLNDALARRVQGGEGKDRLLLEAKEIVYNNDTNTVSAVGDVEINYQGRTLQADRVIYDRNTGRVHAEGNARMTEASGAVITGSRFELTEDFRNGFIDSLRVEQTVVQRGRATRTYFTAPRAERVEGEQMVFERGTYTACEPCREHPERPPLWQVKAARIIHNNEERTIYYENATIELYGMPIAYMPYFWTPDPTVKRKTGFLAPHYIASSSLGTGAAVPFFWAIAPNMDLTLQPTFLSRQGVLGQAEWRHRLLTGSYNIRAAGIFQQDPTAFLPSPLGAQDRNFRGSLESTGQFHINERWRWGWDVALLSDKWFLANYRIKSESIQTLYLKESISTIYLQGQGDRSWFDARGYYFKGLSTYDWQKQQPVVHPVVDYNKRIDGPRPIGGEVAFDLNLTSLTRDTAHFSQIPNINFGLFNQVPSYNGYYETCAIFQRGVCILRGAGGTFTRLSTQLSWRRNYVDAAGQVWTPFAYVRADGFWNNYDTNGFLNSQITNFLGGNDEFVGRVMPAVGLEYRYPFVAQNDNFGMHVVEPIGQIVARPNESRIGRLPNEDAQSLVFDDTTIFNWDKFSGYDRVEGGLRANAGAQYSFTGVNGFYANALVGQSYQLAGRNSYRPGDVINVGRDSGLESRASDVVTRLLVKPNQNFAFSTRARFDENDFTLHRFEQQVTANWNPVLPLTTSLIYGKYARQPELGYDHRREGLMASASVTVTPRWSFGGNLLFDLDRYLASRDNFAAAYTAYTAAITANPLAQISAPVYRRPSDYTPISTGLTLQYMDECTTFGISYSASPREIALSNGEKERVQTLLVRLELRTLGEANVKQTIGPVPASNDGTVTPIR
ncbi:MAG TPA: LPS-assembly protein LptD [Beijerinckiaceae bacterium]|jgi:LPS-assembly protein